MPSPLVSIRDLKVHFDLGGGTLWDKVSGGSPERRIVKAVDGVNLDIQAGETLGLVGESGCGKSTTSMMVMRLLDLTSGHIAFDGEDIGAIPAKSFAGFKLPVVCPRYKRSAPGRSLTADYRSLEAVAKPVSSCCQGTVLTVPKWFLHDSGFSR